MSKKKSFLDDNNPLNWIGQEPVEEKKTDNLPQEELKEVQDKKIGRPRTLTRVPEKSSQEGLPTNWTRYTIIVQEDLLKDLKDYAYTSRRSIKEVVNEMLGEYLEGKEIIERGEKDE